ncbi:MAG: tRNA dimethylallyltransferase, partial [Gammaproteobacteria bacterium]|nr:tRNA dimethylallyltransferase [Gammaproteobacteria bacterium]
DLDLDKPSMRCVGYRQIWQYLDGEFDYQTMRDKGVAATRQLAKRQITWLRRENELNWVTTAKANTLNNALDIIRSKINLSS